MLADEVHQELDGKQRNHKGDRRAQQQQAPLCSGDGGQSDLEDELENLVGAGAEHDRNRHKEGKLGRNKARAGQQHCAQDGRAGARGAWNDGEQLKDTDADGGAVAQLVKAADARLDAAVALLQQDEQYAVENQRDGDDRRVVEALGDPVVHQQSDDADGQDGCDDLEPQLEGLLPLRAGLGQGKRIELVKIQHNDRQNRTQLDDDIEHIHKVLGLVEV